MASNSPAGVRGLRPDRHFHSPASNMDEMSSFIHCHGNVSRLTYTCSGDALDVSSRRPRAASWGWAQRVRTLGRWVTTTGPFFSAGREDGGGVAPAPSSPLVREEMAERRAARLGRARAPPKSTPTSPARMRSGRGLAASSAWPQKVQSALGNGEGARVGAGRPRGAPSGVAGSLAETQKAAGASSIVDEKIEAELEAWKRTFAARLTGCNRRPFSGIGA